MSAPTRTIPCGDPPFSAFRPEVPVDPPNLLRLTHDVLERLSVETTKTNIFSGRSVTVLVYQESKTVETIKRLLVFSSSLLPEFPNLNNVFECWTSDGILRITLLYNDRIFIENKVNRLFIDAMKKTVRTALHIIINGWRSTNENNESYILEFYQEFFPITYLIDYCIKLSKEDLEMRSYVLQIENRRAYRLKISGSTAKCRRFFQYLNALAEGGVSIDPSILRKRETGEIPGRQFPSHVDHDEDGACLREAMSRLRLGQDIV